MNRLFENWVQGGVPVRANERVRLNITALMFRTVSVWPGHIAVDDISFVSGDCPVQQGENKNILISKRTQSIKLLVSYM